ncbi:hypothetical protein SH611_19195 [Geminicoccaceae bacterium 1502E]|nr:hypothetical protein [Geminicoccaceae bacterium 1502E]
MPGFPVLALLAAILAAGVASSASAQSCRWDGTAPFCSGACRSGESESLRASSLPDHWRDAFPVIQNTNFGESCWTGSKVLCCPAPVGSECRWDGTAPFCEGSCGPGEQQRPPAPENLSGAGCVTGSKVYCCRSNTGTSRSALQTNQDLTSFAALWDQSPGPAWQARHGLGAQDYQRTFEGLVAQGFRPVLVRGYAVGGEPRFAAIFEQRQGPPFVARHDLGREAYQREFDRWTGEGYRPVDVAGFTAGGTDRYTAIFEKIDGPPFRAFHGISAARYQQEFDSAVRDGFRPVRVSGYTIDGQDHYAAIFEQRAGPGFAARHGLSSEQYQQAFDQLGREGYHLVHLSSWKSGAAGHYAAVWEKGDGPAWQARHEMLADSYQEEFDRLASAGYRLREVSGYHLYE